MVELYNILANPENGEIFTLITVALLCFAYLSFVWGNNQRLGNDLTTFEWGQIYILGIIVFLCGVTVFGKFIFPENIDLFLGMFGLDSALNYLTVRFQAIVLGILRAMM